MSFQNELKGLRAQRVKLIEDASAILVAAKKEGRDITGEESARFDKMHADAETVNGKIKRYETQEDAERHLSELRGNDQTAGREDRSGDGSQEIQISDADQAKFSKRAMYRFLAGQKYAHLLPSPTAKELQYSQSRTRDIDPETRALAVGTSSAGGYTVPQDFERTLDVALKYYGGIMEAAAYIDTDNGQLLPYPTMNATANSATITAENTAAGTTANDPTFGVVNLSAYNYLTDVVLLPYQLLQDSAFDLQSEIANALAENLFRKVNTDLTTGDGSSKPNGVVTASAAGVSAASATAISYNDLVGLEHSVDRLYRIVGGSYGAGFMMNDSTLAAIKKLLDSNNRPLFISGGVTGDLSQKAPDTILGYPVFVNNDMAAIAAGNKSVLFGAFKKYKIRRVRGIGLINLNERYAEKLQIGVLAYQRFDGNLINAGTNPIKRLTHPTS
jgi:HK97 family phage major capsid protein